MCMNASLVRIFFGFFKAHVDPCLLYRCLETPSFTFPCGYSTKFYILRMLQWKLAGHVFFWHVIAYSSVAESHWAQLLSSVTRSVQSPNYYFWRSEEFGLSFVVAESKSVMLSAAAIYKQEYWMPVVGIAHLAKCIFCKLQKYNAVLFLLLQQ